MKKLCVTLLLSLLLVELFASNLANELPAMQRISGEEDVLVGADRLAEYIPLLRGKSVGLMGNQTSVVGKERKHLVDVLIREGVDVKFVLTPEHGFRGQIERGEKVMNDIDENTGLPLFSLYGRNDKQDSIVKSVDVMLFDLQDVGARFYTYITSLHRVMELAVKHDKELIVLDRPNPCGDQIDGPVRKSDRFKSDVSFHKIAMVHGLTVGELAEMINGEGWLQEGKKCKLTVVRILNWDHATKYQLPVIPSPSLPNYLSVRLYSSLCLFEATDISVGRGTDWPFQVIGYDDEVYGDFTFTPQERKGMEKHVEGKGKMMHGVDLRSLDPGKQVFTLSYFLDFYNKTPDKSKFFTRPEFFDKLAGTDLLRKQILAGLSEEEIRESWQDDLNEYKKVRAKYLLYSDF